MADESYAGMTPEEFLDRNPQFRTAGDENVGAALAKAATIYDATACGKFYEQIVEAKAADLLASGAYGQVLPQPVTQAQRNIYQNQVKELVGMIPKRGLVLR